MAAQHILLRGQHLQQACLLLYYFEGIAPGNCHPVSPPLGRLGTGAHSGQEAGGVPMLTNVCACCSSRPCLGARALIIMLTIICLKNELTLQLSASAGTALPSTAPLRSTRSPSAKMVAKNTTPSSTRRTSLLSACGAHFLIFCPNNADCVGTLAEFLAVRAQGGHFHPQLHPHCSQPTATASCHTSSSMAALLTLLLMHCVAPASLPLGPAAVCLCLLASLTRATCYTMHSRPSLRQSRPII